MFPTGRLKLPHDRKRFIDMLIGGEMIQPRGKLGEDFATTSDYIGEALNEPVTNFYPANVLGAWYGRRNMELIGRGDPGTRIGDNGKFPGTEMRIRGKLLQTRKIVGRDADDGGAHRLEFAYLGGKGMGLKVATLRIGRREKIEHHWPLPERTGQIEFKDLSAQASRAREIGRDGAHLECR